MPPSLTTVPKMIGVEAVKDDICVSFAFCVGVTELSGPGGLRVSVSYRLRPLMGTPAMTFGDNP